MVKKEKDRADSMLLTGQSRRQEKDIKSTGGSGPFQRGGQAGARRSLRGASNIRPF